MSVNYKDNFFLNIVNQNNLAEDIVQQTIQEKLINYIYLFENRHTGIQTLNFHCHTFPLIFIYSVTSELMDIHTLLYL